MPSLKEEAQAYEPKHTKNIADLDAVSTSIEIHTAEGIDKENNPFTYKYVTVDGVDYRVPFKVLGDLKVLQEENPAMTLFKVKKTGEGLSTKYTVVPLQETVPVAV